MTDLFNLVGNLFGYILWAAFWLFKNFGLAIIVFTVIVKLLLLPFSVKQQKSMSANARFQKKQREIMEKYGNDRMKANEEVQKLMQKEGVSPTAGCSTMIAPMIVMLGVYYSVISPLSNTIHIASDKVSAAVQSFSALPAIGSSINVRYGEISILRYFDVLQKYLVDSNGKSLFSSSDIESINEFKNGFNFLGWDLLATPNTSSFQSMLWLIPVLCFVTSVASMLIMQKMNGTKMQGCMVGMILMMPLMSAFFCFTLPIGMGIYWIAGSVIRTIQQIFINKHLNKIGIDAIIEQNKKKAAKKAERKKAKKGIYRENVLEAAQNKAKAKADDGMSAKDKEAKLQKAKEAAAKKQGSLASKANLVSEFNKKNN